MMGGGCGRYLRIQGGEVGIYSQGAEWGSVDGSYNKETSGVKRDYG